MLIFSRVSLLCAALLAVLGTARAEEITRVFELRHADAGQVAAVLGGQPPDRVGVGDRWASNVINEALAWAAPRGGTPRDPAWRSFADLLPPSRVEGAGQGLADVFGLPPLSRPPVAVPGRNALIVRGPPEAVDRIAEVLQVLDQPADMVNVEVKVEDAPVRVVRGWGVDLHAWGEGIAARASGRPALDGPTLSWGRGRAGLSATFADVESRSRTLTAVNGTTTSGLPIDVAFGQVLPFFTASVYYDAFGRRHVDYTPNAVFVGVRLWCLPVVTASNVVRMTLRPTFSYFAGAIVSPKREVVPIVTYQDVATTVSVSDGESLVIGGFRELRDDAQQQFRGLLSDVRVYDSSNPIMIVTPRIIHSFPAE